MDRREFLTSATMAGVTPFLRSKSGGSGAITKITILRVPGEFARPVAMNAYDKKPVGKNGAIRLLRATTADGAYGLAVEGYVPIGDPALQFLKSMIGVDPEEVFLWKGDHIAGHSAKFANQLKDERNCFFEMALLDLVGKRRSTPVYRLFGAPVRDGIEVYDGSLYFVDVASGRGAEAVAETAKAIRGDGYRGLKIKVGRPWKWMPGEAGVTRDIEVVIAAREAVGANMNLMADANNGYDKQFDWAIRFMKETSLYKLGWIEEIFPETIEDYKRFHLALQNINADAPVADGESVRDMDAFRPYLEAGLYRHIQPDMRTCGFSKVLYASKLAEPYRVNVAPHNWMSELGKIVALHASKICRNIPLIEDDRYHDSALDTSAYAFRDGRWIVPEKPGWGVELSPEYDYFARLEQEMVIS